MGSVVAQKQRVSDLDASGGIKHSNSPVEDAERPLHLQREINVSCSKSMKLQFYFFTLEQVVLNNSNCTWSIDEVDPMIVPVKRDRCGLYGDAALSLLSHEICNCVPIVHI